jgi:hypothetical protein
MEPRPHDRKTSAALLLRRLRQALRPLQPRRKRPILRKFSEHGLGHLRNPIDPTGNVHQLAEQVWLQILGDSRSQGR